MCRTVHALLQTLICGVQMLVRVFMTIILMLENLIRMILQTLYNFISFLLQLLSLIPICVVFLVSARLKCFMCGGGGPCPVNRGGACDCVMSLVAIIILFFIFRATGIMDKIFYSLGYTKARPQAKMFVPTPGDITECSRNETEFIDYIATTEEMTALYTSSYLQSLADEYKHTFIELKTPASTFIANEETSAPSIDDITHGLVENTDDEKSKTINIYDSELLFTTMATVTESIIWKRGILTTNL